MHVRFAPESGRRLIKLGSAASWLSGLMHHSKRLLDHLVETVVLGSRHAIRAGQGSSGRCLRADSLSLLVSSCMSTEPSGLRFSP